MKILGRNHVFTGNEFVRSKRPTADGYDMPHADLVGSHWYFPLWMTVCSKFGGCWKGRRMIEEMEKEGSDVNYLYEFAEFEKGEILPELGFPASCFLVQQWGVDTRADEYVQFYVDNHNKWSFNRMSLCPDYVTCPECGGRVIEISNGYGSGRKCFECNTEISRR